MERAASNPPLSTSSSASFTAQGSSASITPSLPNSSLAQQAFPTVSNNNGSSVSHSSPLFPSSGSGVGVISAATSAAFATNPITIAKNQALHGGVVAPPQGAFPQSATGANVTAGSTASERPHQAPTPVPGSAVPPLFSPTQPLPPASSTLPVQPPVVSPQLVPAESRIFEELLDAEVFMNPSKLRESARQGIPEKYRGVVYRYLIGTTSMDKSSEMTTEQMQEDDFKLLEQVYVNVYGSRLLSTFSSSSSGGCSAGSVLPYRNSHNTRGDGVDAWDELFLCCRSLPTLRDDIPRRRCMESVLRALTVSHVGVTYAEADLIFSFALVFSVVAKQPWEVYHTTEALLTLLRSNGNVLSSSWALRDHCSTFLMLFHNTNEALYMHFHVEEVLSDAWLPDYLQCLLAKQLHIDDLLRLWDTYLADCSEVGGFPLHIFVCLSLLSIFTEELLEMDNTQIVMFLRKLPRVNVESVLQRSLSIREEVISRELL